MKTQQQIPAGLTITELSRHIDYSGERPQFRFQLQLTGPGGSAVFPYFGGILAFLNRDNAAFRHIAKNNSAIQAVLAGKRLTDSAKEKKCLETIFRFSKPDGLGLLSALVMDSEALECGFEEWCDNLGMNQDSRKDLALYEQCRAQSREFRRVVGDKMDEIRAAVEDY